MLKLFSQIKMKVSRAFVANTFMLIFIILTGIGTYMILPAAGFIVAGIASGLYGFLLGSE